MAKLAAAPPTVIVDVEAGQQDGTTEVSYEKERDHVLWERTDFDAWVQRPIAAGSPTASAHQRGTFMSRKLRPGAFYEVIVLNPDINANSGFDIAEARLAVAALRKRPEERKLVRDETMDEGGTWCGHGVFTTTQVIALLQVGTAPPTEDADGFLTFGSVVGQTYSDFATSHDLEVLGLLPGTNYHELVRVSDQYGNWEFRTRQFTTLRRKVTVNLVKIRVDDDSDDLSEGEGHFYMRVYTGDGEKWAHKKAEFDYYNDSFDTGEELAVGRSESFGPESVPADSRAVGLQLHGVEDDKGSFPATGDDMTDFTMRRLTLREGRTHEVMKPGTPEEIEVAASKTSGEFRFTAYVTYAVDYEP